MQFELSVVLKVVGVTITLLLAFMGLAIHSARIEQKLEDKIEELTKKNEVFKNQFKKLYERENEIIKTNQELKRQIETIQTNIRNLHSENDVARYYANDIELRIEESQLELFRLFIEANKKATDEHLNRTR